MKRKADDSLLFSSASAIECVAISDILDNYTKAFGQLINYSKSVMCVSRSFSLNERSRLAGILGIRLCTSKDSGGLGFHDFAIFNRALLAKQGWRLMSNRQSLATRVLKSKYYPNSSFLEAKHCSFGSFVWHSLLWGHGILVAGSRWRISNGSSVRVYGDRWIPRLNTFCVQSPCILGENATWTGLLRLLWIPTSVNIARGGVMTGVDCPICGVEPESTLHALWGCLGLADVRSSSVAFQKLPWSVDGSFMDFITSCARILVVMEMEFLCVVLWCIWWMRNQVAHGVFNRREESIVGWAYDFLFKFREANFKGSELTHPRPISSSSWSAPDYGMYKVNTDAAVKGDLSSSSLLAVSGSIFFCWVACAVRFAALAEEVIRIKNEHPDDSQCIANVRVKGRLKVPRAFGAGFLKQLRINRLAFTNLCTMLENRGGLRAYRYLQIDEQVAMFLHILAHHVKNRVIKFQFMRSGETVSKYFHNVLYSVIRLHRELLKRPEPVDENSTDERWRWFKNCLGALDGTHVKVRVHISEKPKYRNRKGDISTNVLGVCSQDMKFIYVLPGWEGSAADGRVLRDAIRWANGLRVPYGYYYLVDAGNTNCTGFLAPFRGQRREMPDDGNDVILEESDDEADESITTVEPSDEWSDMRMNLAGHIWTLIYLVVIDILSHKEAAPFKLKSFPYYDELSMIFGKDRATEQHAETPADVEKQLQNEKGDNNLDDNTSNENVDNASDNNVDIQIVSKSSKRSQSQTECSSTSKKQRKNKSSGDLVEALTESTATLVVVIEKSSARLSRAIGEDLNEKHMQLGNELSRTTTLPIMERHKFFRLIVQDNALVSYFFSLPDELKDDWAKGILVGTI
ncbi:hypothetical protein Ddye_019612 [Dipteronia dyeriana]|uniref:DDE Tnp4 domain-containing protein n=1 Tax=Dipteronia dyeriana TaxID=168575 RepID=A0AAD9WVW8_9ROSI|nr:hypothetical protein Ddye_019612 [Dipteronia dyeriana]